MKIPQKVGISGVAIFIIGLIVGWGVIPPIVTNQIDKRKGLAPGSESRQFWEKIPFSLDFKVYIFNVTNYEAVHATGDVPKLREIGPYIFDEWKEKVELVDFEEDDSVSFRMKNTFVFNKEKSAPLTGREVIAVPHPLLMGVIVAAERDKPSVLGIINRAIPSMFGKPSSIFLKATVLEFLFEGTHVNCTSKEFQTMAVCAVLKKDVKDFLPTNVTNLFIYSVLGAKNATADPNTIRVHRGINDASKVGQMMSVNGRKKSQIWSGSPCNDFKGTDSTVFPPALKYGSPIWSYSVDICRSLPGKFVETSTYKGIESFRYSVSLGDTTKDASLKCFCSSKQTCSGKGAMDLMPCTGGPVIATLPHFYDAEESYLNGVRGLNPRKKEHEITFEIEPMTGTPLYAKKRLMFSMPVHSIKAINLTSNVPNATVPLFWVEESLELEDRWIEKINSELFWVLRIVDISKWLTVTSGVVIMIVGIALHMKKRNMVVPPVQDAGKGAAVTPHSDVYWMSRGTGREALGGRNNFGYIP